MRKTVGILIQTTIPQTADDWHVGRFSLLRSVLDSYADEGGNPLFAVTARDRTGIERDPLLSTLDESDFDELWLFAVDDGHGLPQPDREGIVRFHRRGGGLLVTRDHQDLGSSVHDLARLGAAHYFHSRNREPDESRHTRDDTETKAISWPNYHSGRNGDFQKVTAVEPIHELLRNPARPSGLSEYFPAHPHEGAVGVPIGERSARVIATSRSLTTGRPFNLAVAFERGTDEHGNVLGRAVAHSSFHHFLDYNWDIDKGCPSFVSETPGNAVREYRDRLDDIQAYVRNLARWLAPASPGHML